MSESNKIHIVGIGDDGVDGLSPRAHDLITKAELLIGPQSLLNSFNGLNAEVWDAGNAFQEIADRLSAEQSRRIVVITPGDPLFYGTARYLCDRLGKERFEVLPHVSTMQLAFARVKESWDESKHPSKEISEIIDEISSYPTDFVVITGGEPSLHNLAPLVTALKDEKKYVAIETSGTNPLPKGIDWVCLSPKKFKKPIEDAYKCANELKVVICHPSDLNWAKEHAKKLNKNVELYLQPEWSRSDKRMNNIIDFINDNPEWKLSLQTHKFLNIP